ncbi:hypothetical protein ACQ4PT_042684 [Festuca glaucescens]
MGDMLSSGMNWIGPLYAIRHSSHASQDGSAGTDDNANYNAEFKGAIVFTVVLMSILGGTLSVVGLERLIRGRFTLFSIVRTLLRSTFILFLPLLSYMFSHSEGNKGELLFLLLWMLLIELIRKKVQAMVQSAGGSFSRASGRFRLMDHSDEATRLVWIGYLMYLNVPRDSRSGDVMPAFFYILWSLALAKLGQRVLNKWMAQDSLAAARNTHLIAGYMQHIVEKHGMSPAGDIAKCEYVVMGEEKLMLHKKDSQKKDRPRRHSEPKVRLTTLHCGYGVGRFPHGQDEQKHVHLLIDLSKVKDLVTVERIWEKIPRLDICCFSTNRWRFMCFSFSLFKLMRRRFEHYPMVEVGSEMARRLMLHGLLSLECESNAEDNAHAVFQVLQIELDFLDNYYEAGVPVVMSAPWLFIFNFIFSILFVLTYVFAILIIVGTYQIDDTLLLYFIVAVLLVMTILAIEITEFLTIYLLSNWFLVHLLCLYVAPGNCLWSWLGKPIIGCFIATRFLVVSALEIIFRLFCRPINRNKMKIKQVSIRQVCEPVHKMLAWTSQVTLPTKAKLDIVQSLKAIDPLGTCHVSLPQMYGLEGDGKTATEILLQCHLATELLDMNGGRAKDDKQLKDNNHQAVAVTLSRYCMYLVARTPELLPDDEIWVSDCYDDMKSCLKKASSWCFCSSAWQGLLDKDEHAAECLEDPTARDGLKLFQRHRERTDKDKVWEEMAQFWVDLLIYMSPSNDVEGHAKALSSSGGDLITCLWAFCTHAGISRPRRRSTNADQQV